MMQTFPHSHSDGGNLQKSSNVNQLNGITENHSAAMGYTPAAVDEHGVYEMIGQHQQQLPPRRNHYERHMVGGCLVFDIDISFRVPMHSKLTDFQSPPRLSNFPLCFSLINHLIFA